MTKTPLNYQPDFDLDGVEEYKGGVAPHLVDEAM